METTTPSNMVASCQDWPPTARPMKPAFFTFSRSAMYWSQVVGAEVTPALASTALLAHTQLVECTSMGAAIQLPL